MSVLTKKFSMKWWMKDENNELWFSFILKNWIYRIYNNEVHHFENLLVTLLRDAVSEDINISSSIRVFSRAMFPLIDHRK